MPKGKYQRKRAMQPDTMGAATVAPEPPPAPSFEEKLLGAVEALAAQIQAQGERLEAVEQNAGLRFIEPQVAANTAAVERSRQAMAAEPDGIPHGMTIPVFPNGEKVPAMVMNKYRPKFGSNSRVLLNLDAVPHGRSDGKTRGELMADAGVPNGYGEVLDRTFLSDTTAEWKYRVRFDKTVMPGSNGGITYLYESELLPA